MSRWLSSRREVEEVTALVATLSGCCRLEVMEQVKEELLTFSMEGIMEAMVDPVSGHMEVGSYLTQCFGRGPISIIFVGLKMVPMVSNDSQNKMSALEKQKI